MVVNKTIRSKLGDIVDNKKSFQEKSTTWLKIYLNEKDRERNETICDSFE